MVLVGTASWTDKTLLATNWYPSEVRHSPEGRLRHYAGIFPTVELDSSYYALPTEKSARSWVQRTPPGFVMHVKAYSAFTGHGLDAAMLPKDLRRLLSVGAGRVPQADVPRRLVDEAWERFCGAIEPLRAAGKLGYLLFQLPPWFQATETLFAFLRRLRERSGSYEVAIEFRHPSWYEPAVWPQVSGLLQELCFVHVVVDAPPVPEAVPRRLEATHPRIAVLRCHGRNAATWRGPHRAASDRFNWDYPPAELQDLAGAALALADAVEIVYVIFNNNYEDQGQRNASALMELLAKG